MKRIVAIVCAALLLTVCLILSACGSEYADSKYIGKWKATKATYSGIHMDVEDVLGGEFSFTLDEDGRFKQKVADKEETGQWEETGKGIQFKGEESMKFSDKDGYLILDYSGLTLVFEKSE